MVEEVIVDIASCLWSTMPIINADESAVRARVKKAQWTRLNLTLVLKQVIGLDNSHGEVPIYMLPGVLVP
jgi:hypothetical protein